MSRPNTPPAAPNFANQVVNFNGFIGSVAALYKIIREKASDYEYIAQSKMLSEKPKYRARATALRLIADNIKSCGSVDAVKAILTEKDLKFKDFEIVNDNIDKLGGMKRKDKSRKGKKRIGKSRKGKSKKGRNGKSKTRRR